MNLNFAIILNSLVEAAKYCYAHPRGTGSVVGAIFLLWFIGFVCFTRSGKRWRVRWFGSWEPSLANDYVHLEFESHPGRNFHAIKDALSVPFFAWVTYLGGRISLDGEIPNPEKPTKWLEKRRLAYEERHLHRVVVSIEEQPANRSATGFTTAFYNYITARLETRPARRFWKLYWTSGLSYRQMMPVDFQKISLVALYEQSNFPDYVFSQFIKATGQKHYLTQHGDGLATAVRLVVKFYKGGKLYSSTKVMEDYRDPLELDAIGVKFAELALGHAATGGRWVKKFREEYSKAAASYVFLADSRTGALNPAVAESFTLASADDKTTSKLKSPAAVAAPALAEVVEFEPQWFAAPEYNPYCPVTLRPDEFAVAYRRIASKHFRITSAESDGIKLAQASYGAFEQWMLKRQKDTFGIWGWRRLFYTAPEVRTDNQQMNEQLLQTVTQGGD